jgi:hypothetical protein
MCRTLKLTELSANSAFLQRDMVAGDKVIGLTVHSGAPKKPAGDVLTEHVLYRGTGHGVYVARAARCATLMLGAASVGA